MASSAAAFLASEFSCGALVLAALLGFGSALALFGQLLLHVEVKHFVVGLDTVNLIVKCNLSSGFLTIYLQYVKFHYF